MLPGDFELYVHGNMYGVAIKCRISTCGRDGMQVSRMACITNPISQGQNISFEDLGTTVQRRIKLTKIMAQGMGG